MEEATYDLRSFRSDEGLLKQLATIFRTNLRSINDPEVYEAYRHYESTPVTFEELYEMRDIFLLLKECLAASKGKEPLKKAAKQIYKDLRIEYIKHLDIRKGRPMHEIKTIRAILEEVMRILKRDVYPLDEIRILLLELPYEEKNLYSVGRLLFFVSLPVTLLSCFFMPVLGLKGFLIGIAFGGILLFAAATLLHLGQYKGLIKSLSNFIYVANSPKRIIESFSYQQRARKKRCFFE